jgi:hypothetical protein
VNLAGWPVPVLGLRRADRVGQAGRPTHRPTR